MTATRSSSRSATEAEILVGRVLDALLREDFLRMRTAGRIVTRADGDWLRFLVGDRAAELAVREGRFQCVYEVRDPALVVDGQRVAGLDPVLDVLACGVKPVDLDGFADFRAECGQALAAVRGQDAAREGVVAALPEPGPGLLTGLRYDTLAAYEEHPVYPTGRCRHDLTEDELHRYAPEFAPRFTLRWLGLPPELVDRQGELPNWWPVHEDRIAVPVHPLTAERLLPELAADLGLADTTTISAVSVAPTLSMRTVAVLGDPGVHIKLPLPTSTLGRRNRRGIKPGTLSDGAITERLLRMVIAREPRFADRVLLADEQTYAQTGHEFLGFLVRRHPAGIGVAEVVSAAALLAPDATGATVLAGLADRYFDGEPLALLDSYLTLLFDWQVTLLAYGIALESHQQNISLLLDAPGGRTRLRLLIRDNDGPRLHPGRLAAALGPDAPVAAGFDRIDDRRMVVDRVGALVDVFTTITVHLCAAAPMFALPAEQAEAGLDLVRSRLAEAIGESPDAQLLRDSVLAAPVLPVKAMVTAGTLLTKQRSGAVDINKFYLRCGPNYLRASGDTGPRRAAG
ncbi:MAG TPA: IucA/IucC family protein [Pseudonocardiaceae bacterium]|nr:IucA/IucC family protein [Pseudonocardiaceae bacterium]